MYDEDEQEGVVPTGYDQPNTDDSDSPAYSTYAGSSGADDNEPPEFLPRDYFTEPDVTGAVTSPLKKKSGELELNEYGEPPEYLTPDELLEAPGISSRSGAALRGAAEGAAPGLAGLGAGIWAGAGIGGALSGPLAPAGALLGGVAGGLATGFGVSKLQDWFLDYMGLRDDPTSNFSRRQRQADEAQFPYARAFGEMVPSTLALRPGGRLIERGISAGIGGLAEGVSDYVGTGHVDPWKVAMGAGVGAALPNINKPFGQAVSRVAPQSWRPHMPGYEPPPPPPPEPFQAPKPQLALPAPEAPSRERYPLDYAVTPAPTERRLELLSPERMAAADRIARQMEMAVQNRDSYQPDANPLDREMHNRWDTHYNSLAERRAAVLSGMGDAQTQAAEGAGGAVPTARVMDTANDVTTTASGNAHVNQPPPKDPGIGSGGVGGPGNKHVADGAVDESKAAVRTAPGEPTVPSTKVETLKATNVPSDVAAAMPKEAPRPAAARPVPTEAQKQEQAARVQRVVDQAKRMGSRGPEPTAEETRIAANDRRIMELEARLAQSQAPPEPAVTAPVTPPARPVPPRAAPAEGPVAKRTEKTADEIETEAESGRAATVAEMKAANARMTPEQIVEDYRAGGDGTYAGALKDLAEGLKGNKDPKMQAAHAIARSKAAAETPKPYVAPEKRPAAPAGPISAANQGKPKLGMPAAKAEPAKRSAYAEQFDAERAAREAFTEAQKKGTPGKWEVLPGHEKYSMKGVQAVDANGDVFTVRPVGHDDGKFIGWEVAKNGDPFEGAKTKADALLRAKAQMKKEGFGAKAVRLGKATEGSIDIGPATRKPTEISREKALKNLTDRRATDFNPRQIANSVLAAAEGDPRYALTLMNRQMTEKRGWALKRNVIEARDILAKQAEGTPARPEPSPPVPDKRGTIPLERTTVPAEPKLEKLPTQTIMLQKDDKGRVIRSEPFDADKMRKWREQLPDDPVTLQEPAGGVPTAKSTTRPAVPQKYEPPELPVKKPAPEPVERPYTPPGKRTPQKVIDPITGEARETMVLRKPPAPEKKLMEDYTPDERARVLEHLDALPEAQQMEALKRLKEVPKETVLTNLKDLGSAADIAREARKMEGRKTATGAKADNPQDRMHKDAILAAHEKAYAANSRPAKAETQEEVVARANRIVKAAQEETNKAVAQLTLDNPKAAHIFTGSLGNIKNKPLGNKMVLEARALKYNPSKKQRMDFDAKEFIALDEAKSKPAREPDIPNYDVPVSNRPDYQPRTDPDSPIFTSEHKELVDFLSPERMSDKMHDMLQDAWGESIAKEVERTKNPLKLKQDLLEALIVKQDEINKNAHALPETLVKTTPVNTRAGIAQVEQTGRFKPTKPHDYSKLSEAQREKAKAEAKVYGPETEYYQKVAPVVLAHFGKRQETAAKLARGEIGGEETAKGKGLEASGRLLGDIPGPYERKPRWMADILGDIARDKNGALDVTKIFSWIDKYQKKFRPDREPMTPTGMTRLYKVEPDGIWAAPTREQLANDKGKPPTKYVDVPTEVIEQYRTDGLSGVAGKAAERFAKKWEKELHLPPAADQRVPVAMEDVGFTDHLRRLWADESGALDVTRLPEAWTNWRAKFRSSTAHNAAPEVKKYAEELSDRAVPMRAHDTSGEMMKLHDAVKAMTREDGGVPSAAENGAMWRGYEDGKLPSRSQPFWDKHIEPLIKWQKELYNDVRNIHTKNEWTGYEDLTEIVDGKVKYLPHRLEGKLDFDPSLNVVTNTTRNSLSPWDQTLQPRSWMETYDKAGKREVYRIDDETGDMMFYKDGVVQTILRKDGLPADFNPAQVGHKLPDGRVVDNPRIDALMQHGRGEPDTVGGNPTKLKYVDNPTMALADSINGLIHARAKAKLLDDVLNNPKFAELSETGRSPSEAQKAAEKKWGVGNVATTTLKQVGLEGRRWFPKQIAWEFDDMVKQGFDYGGSQAMEGLSRLTQAANKLFFFLGPQVHVMNVMDKLVIGRGYDNFNPAKTWRNGGKALKEVYSQGPMTHLYTKAGGNPMYVHSATVRMMPNIARMLNVKINEKPWVGDPIRKVFGIDLSPKGRRLYQVSDQVMWWQSDVMGQMLFHDNLDRLGGGHKNWEKKFAELGKLNELKNPTADQVRKRDELDKWQMDLARKAVKETEKIVDGYTIPTTFGKTLGLEDTDWGRMIQKVLSEPMFTNFGRFSYGLYKTLANITKNMIGKNENLSKQQSMALGFSQAATLTAMIGIIYPALTKLYSMMPWAKPESEFEKRGISSVASIPLEIAEHGIRDKYGRISQRLWSPSALASTVMETAANRDFAGRPIIESGSGWGDVPGQLAEYGVSKMWSPIAQVSRAAVKEGPEYAALRFIESNFGVKTPTDAMIKYKTQHERTLRQQGRTREKNPRGVIEAAGNEVRKLVRGYEKGGLVTATETGVIPTSRG